jgi:hypothetical protein
VVPALLYIFQHVLFKQAAISIINKKKMSGNNIKIFHYSNFSNYQKYGEWAAIVHLYYKIVPLEPRQKMSGLIISKHEELFSYYYL